MDYAEKFKKILFERYSNTQPVMVYQDCVCKCGRVNNYEIKGNRKCKQKGCHQRFYVYITKPYEYSFETVAVIPVSDEKADITYFKLVVDKDTNIGYETKVIAKFDFEAKTVWQASRSVRGKNLFMDDDWKTLIREHPLFWNFTIPKTRQLKTHELIEGVIEKNSLINIF